jgi:hypothetical protein
MFESSVLNAADVFTFQKTYRHSQFKSLKIESCTAELTDLPKLLVRYDSLEQLEILHKKLRSSFETAWQKFEFLSFIRNAATRIQIFKIEKHLVGNEVK